jgi:hypothetical protein
MARRKRGAQVVIVRKEKRMNPLTHLAAFALTGGMSSVVSAARAAQVASYNARTRKLQEQSEQDEAEYEAELLQEQMDAERPYQETLAEMAARMQQYKEEK